jgi:hypothetical protein
LDAGDGISRSLLQSRAQRAIAWLIVAVGTHVCAGAATFVSAGMTIATSDGAATAWACGAFFIAFLSSAGLIRAELRASSRGRPAWWPRRAFGAAIPQAVALWVAASALLDQPGSRLLIIGALAGASIQISSATMASRSIQLPYIADLGELDVEIVAKIRRGHPPDIPFLSSNEVTLTAEELRFTLQPDLSYKFEHTIRLAAIVGVNVRDVDSCDAPWCVLDDGRSYPTPPGEALVVHTGRGSQVLPIFGAQGYAEVLRVRVRRARADANRPEASFLEQRDST